jgi:hypothetical protein
MQKSKQNKFATVYNWKSKRQKKKKKKKKQVAKIPVFLSQQLSDKVGNNKVIIGL